MKYNFTEILSIAGERHNESMFNKGDLTDKENQARQLILALLGIDVDELGALLDTIEEIQGLCCDIEDGQTDEFNTMQHASEIHDLTRTLTDKINKIIKGD